MGEACYRCSKYMLMIFNFILLLLGCGLIGAGLWLRLDPNSQRYVDSTADLQQYYLGTYVMIGCGALMILVGFIGCCGACCENQCLLCFYFLCLVCLFVVEVGGGVWIYFNKQEVAKLINDGLTHAVTTLYGTDGNEKVTEAIDSIQQEFECCGVSGPGDWMNSSFSTVVKIFAVPDSCCEDMSIDCGQGKIIGSIIPFDVGIYKDGCASAIAMAVERNYVLMAGIGIGVGVIQLLGMMFSLCMCCSLRRGSNSKEYVY
ncbi:CD9 antigen-like isoform X2 [Glandiceps talaboti]